MYVHVLYLCVSVFYTAGKKCTAQHIASPPPALSIRCAAAMRCAAAPHLPSQRHYGTSAAAPDAQPTWFAQLKSGFTAAITQHMAVHGPWDMSVARCCCRTRSCSRAPRQIHAVLCHAAPLLRRGGACARPAARRQRHHPRPTRALHSRREAAGRTLCCPVGAVRCDVCCRWL